MRLCRLFACLVLLGLLFRPSFSAEAAEITRYPLFDLVTSKNIFLQLTSLEESVNSLQRWVEKEFSDAQVASETKTYREKIQKAGQELKNLKVSPELSPLLGTFMRTSGEMEGLASQIEEKVKSTHLDSVEDLRTLLLFLREFSLDLFRIQKRMAESSLDTQKKWDFSKEKPWVRDYYRWNTPLSALILKEMKIFSAAEELLYRVMDNFQSSEALRLAGQNLLAQSRSLQGKAEALKPAPEVAGLHRRYVEYLGDFVLMMQDMNGVLESPGLENMKALESKASLISQKSLDFTRSYISFMEDNFVKR